jgi:hypothetical protein
MGRVQSHELHTSCRSHAQKHQVQESLALIMLMHHDDENELCLQAHKCSRL